MKVGLCGLGDRLGYLAEVFRRAIPEFEPVAYADPAPAGLTAMKIDESRRTGQIVDLTDHFAGAINAGRRFGRDSTN